MFNSIEQITKYISEGDLEAAIKALLEIAELTGKNSIYNEVLQLSGSLERHKSERRLNIIENEDYDISIEKISNALIELLQNIPPEIDVLNSNNARLLTIQKSRIDYFAKNTVIRIMEEITPGSGESPDYRIDSAKYVVEKGLLDIRMSIFWKGKATWLSPSKKTYELKGDLLVYEDGKAEFIVSSKNTIFKTYEKYSRNNHSSFPLGTLE